jgi:enamine deaminase RidA (YjgF/YER057c/UK114 family)
MGKQAAAGFQEILDRVAELEKYEYIVAGFGDTLSEVKEGVASWAATGTGPSLEGMSKQITILEQYQQGLIDARTAVTALRSAEQEVTEGGGSLSAHIDGLIARLENLGSNSEQATTTIQQLVDVLTNIQTSIADKTGGLLLQPADITDVLAAEAALAKLENTAKKGLITNADVQAARDAFQAIRDGAAQTLPALDQIKASAMSADDGLEALENAFKVSIGGNAEEAARVAAGLEELGERYKLTADEIRDIYASLEARHPAAALEVELQKLGPGAKLVVDQIRALTERMIAYGEAADNAGDKADILMANLKAMRDAGQLTEQQFTRLYEALQPWVEVMMGGGFGVPDFTSVELSPLLEINKILEQIVETGKASEAQIRAVEEQAAESDRLSVENIRKSPYASLPIEYGGLGEAADAAKQTDDAYKELTSGLETFLSTFNNTTKDVSYAEAVFTALIARIENLVGTTATAEAQLIHMRGSLQDLASAAAAGQTMDPNVVKGYAAALEYLEQQQRGGIVSAEDLQHAWDMRSMEF